MARRWNPFVKFGIPLISLTVLGSLALAHLQQGRYMCIHPISRAHEGVRIEGLGFLSRRWDQLCYCVWVFEPIHQMETRLPNFWHVNMSLHVLHLQEHSSFVHVWLNARIYIIGMNFFVPILRLLGGHILQSAREEFGTNSSWRTKGQHRVCISGDFLNSWWEEIMLSIWSFLGWITYSPHSENVMTVLQVVYKILNDVHNFYLIESGLPLGWVNLNGHYLLLIIFHLQQSEVQILKSR
jgi:hypothetical protein